MNLDLAELLKEADKLSAKGKDENNKFLIAQQSIAEQLGRIADCMERTDDRNRIFWYTECGFILSSCGAYRIDTTEDHMKLYLDDAHWILCCDVADGMRRAEKDKEMLSKSKQRKEG